MSTNHNLFEEKGEPKRNRTEALPLTSLTPYRWAKPALDDDCFYIALFSALEQTHCAPHTIPIASLNVATTRTISALRWAATRAADVSLNVRCESHKDSVLKPQLLKREDREAKQGVEPTSPLYQHNALPLGQTCSEQFFFFFFYFCIQCPISAFC